MYSPHSLVICSQLLVFFSKLFSPHGFYSLSPVVVLLFSFLDSPCCLPFFFTLVIPIKASLSILPSICVLKIQTQPCRSTTQHQSRWETCFHPEYVQALLVMSVSCCAERDVCRFPRLEWRPRCTARLRGGFLRAGRHVGKIWPLLPAAPPVLEQATSAWGCGSLLTLLAGGAWSRLSLSGPWRQLLKLNWKTTDPVNFFWTVSRSGTQEELFLFSW